METAPEMYDVVIVGAGPCGTSSAMHLLKRVGQPEEVAELVTFLVSEQSSFMTGAAIPIDGGITAVVGGPRPRQPGERP